MRGSNAGLAADGALRKECETKSSYHSFLLHILDTIFTSFVCGPLVVGYWRGTWNLSAEYLFPHDKLHSAFTSLAIGVMGHLIFTIFQSTFKSLFNPAEHRLTFYVGSRLYTSIFAVICVNTWRGGWQVKVAFISW
jgi:Fuseless